MRHHLACSWALSAVGKVRCSSCSLPDHVVLGLPAINSYTSKPQIYAGVNSLACATSHIVKPQFMPASTCCLGSGCNLIQGVDFAPAWRVFLMHMYVSASRRTEGSLQLSALLWVSFSVPCESSAPESHTTCCHCVGSAACLTSWVISQGAVHCSKSWVQELCIAQVHVTGKSSETSSPACQACLCCCPTMLRATWTNG